MGHAESKFQPAKIAVLTVSDTRTEENDTSGRFLVENAQDAGHQVLISKLLLMICTKYARLCHSGLLMTTCKPS